MHGPINVKSPNNTSKWQMGFNSAFKGLNSILLLFTPLYYSFSLLLFFLYFRLSPRCKCVLLSSGISLSVLVSCGPGSSVGIAAGYGLDGLGIESQSGRNFSHLSRPALGLTLPLLYNGYQVFPGGKERPGCDADPLPTSSAVGHERVELHLYSPYGPYGLYGASVPVQGCTLS